MTSTHPFIKSSLKIRLFYLVEEIKTRKKIVVFHLTRGMENLDYVLEFDS